MAKTGWMAGAVMASVLAGGTMAMAEQGQTNDTPSKARSLSLEELMQVEVISASRSKSTLLDTPAAAFVITEEDIRRSGATTLPDVLRLAPGVDVARIDAARYAVSIRGFTSQFSNKLLVLVDGRSLYKPLFAGTVWEVQDMLLDNIERIEVIRGPGASTWGANAVNGVINIVTKSASQTQGNMVLGRAGDEETWTGAGRHGGRLGETATYRVYARAFERDGGVDPNGNDLPDLWRSQRAGFRIDAEPGAFDLFMLSGDIYQSDSQLAGFSPRTPGRVTTADVDSEGGNLLSQWTRAFSSSSKLVLRGYIDHGDRTVEEGLQETRTVYDLDAQHDFALGTRQQLTWGAAVNVSDDETEDSPAVSYDPNNRTFETYSAFVQDDITLLPEELFLTLGVKLENHEYTDWEALPTARILAKPSERQSVWASVSRAVRTPSRAEIEGNSLLSVVNSTQPPQVWRAFGNDDVESENLIAYETGYRIQASDDLIVDLALFYNDYEDLVSIERGTPTPSPSGATVLVPFNGDNNLEGDSYGGEVTTEWRASDTWRLQAMYGYITIDLDTTGNGTDELAVAREEGTPEHHALLRSLFDVTRDIDFDLTLRFVDDREGRGVEDYTALDARVAWRPRKDMELAIVGQNLTDSQHPEFGTQFANTVSTEVERSVYGQVTCWF